MMKKFLFILFAVLLNVNAFSQNHLEFNGVSMNSEINSFTKKLESKGYELKEYIGSNAIMEGTFTNHSAQLIILGTNKTKMVWKVSVKLASEFPWADLKNLYQDYKELYTKKYGKPHEHFEFFSKPYYEGDGYELQALKLGKCNYITFYKLETGYITVGLSEDGCLQLVYEDNINGELSTEERKSIVFEDI